MMTATPIVTTPSSSDVMLFADKLTRRFGGLLANQEVSLCLECNTLHALLGPNGAGKSTFINLLSGALPPSSGHIYLADRDITNLSATERSQAGIGRSYQQTNIFPTFTVLENVRLAAQSRRQMPWRILSLANKQAWSINKAESALKEVHLWHQAHCIAGSMSHGEQRQLELAMVLATDAQVLLLDEPLAGMGLDESEKMVELLKHLRCARAILLVEHDMDAVFAVANTITVMVNGQVLESGNPEQIRNSVAVQQAYLGVEETFYD